MLAGSAASSPSSKSLLPDPRPRPRPQLCTNLRVQPRVHVLAIADPDRQRVLFFLQRIRRAPCRIISGDDDEQLFRPGLFDDPRRRLDGAFGTRSRAVPSTTGRQELADSLVGLF